MTRWLRAIMVLSLAGLLAACAGQRPTPMAPAPIPTGPELPAPEQAVFTQSGLASWYGRNHHGKTTASGEPFDMEALTAAHRNLPFGTVVRVTSAATNRTIKVRINDRGPYIAGRVIDLSARAARDLGIAKMGVGPVRVDQFASDQPGGR